MSDLEAARSRRALTPSDAMDVARLAYIYGLPAYEVARLRYRALSLPRRAGPPLQQNTFWHTRELSTPDTAVVTAVNSDTLLSRAWIDLSRGPLVVHLPEPTGRYYSVALMDVFTNNFAVLGRHDPASAKGRVLLAGPHWDGEAPAETPLVRAPGHLVWALVRVLVDGADDVAAVHALQDQLRLSRWGPPADPRLWSPDPLTRPVLPQDDAKPLIFLDVLGAVLAENPPPAEDGPVLDRLALIGVGPGLQFRRADFAGPQLAAMREGLMSARDLLRAEVSYRTLGPRKAGPEAWPSDELLARMHPPEPPSGPNRRLGWSGPVGSVGRFGTDYRLRAQCALAGLGLLPREEAMYFTTASDADGTLLHGRHDYVLRFAPDGLPPVDAFWSLTAYQTDENHRRWLPPNAIDRYSLGDRKPDLRYGPDGSLDIRIQHRPPAHPENWLPVPEAPFMLTMRTYRPRQALRQGHYRIPDLRLVTG